MCKKNYQFKCRVFAGRILSVDCPGFPSELFAAKIVNGRITLRSIARRQCEEYMLNKTLLKQRKEKDATEKPVSSAKKPSEIQLLSERNKLPESRFPTPDIVRRVTAQRNKSPISSRSRQDISLREAVLAEKHVPLANSTPTVRRLSKENRIPKSNFSTPDIVRRATTQQRTSPITSPFEIQRVKVIPLYRTPTQNLSGSMAKLLPITRKNSEKQKTGCVTQIQIFRNVSNLSNFESLSTPNRTHNTVPKSPNQTLISKLITSPRCTADKWRKCLTPKRTYLRPNGGGKQQAPINKSTTPLQLSNMPKVVPNYFINQTKNPAGEEKILFRRRKLIVDQKLMISPKTYKKQLQHTDDLKRIATHLPKTKKHFLCSHKLAFDLLTNSSFYPRCANVLNSRFRRGCVNKKSDTILKYQPLARNIPPLEE